MAKVKVCGLTKPSEAEVLADLGVAYAGMVLFYPKSKRNVDETQAKNILAAIQKRKVSRSVAVVVSPTVEQVTAIADLGFDYIQIHGECSPEAYHACTIPIIRAWNMKKQSKQQIQETLAAMERLEKVEALLCDAGVPGSGMTFDWNTIKNIQTHKTLFLAGGLHADNVAEAIRQVAPDVVDVSSGVEYDLTEGEPFRGKDMEKIRQFVQAVQEYVL